MTTNQITIIASYYHGNKAQYITWQFFLVRIRKLTYFPRSAVHIFLFIFLLPCFHKITIDETGHHINPFSAGTVLRRQNLTSNDGQCTEKVKKNTMTGNPRYRYSNEAKRANEA